MLESIVSGGQTGVDQAALRAAKRFGLETAGWMPSGCLTEDGPRYDLLETYGMRELPGADYPARTRKNVDDSDATLWLGDHWSPGGKLTVGYCQRVGKSCIVSDMAPGQAGVVAAWVKELLDLRTLNVAGSRESRCPGIGERAEAFLADVLRLLGFTEKR